MKLTHILAFRLLVILLVLVVISTAVFTTLTVKRQATRSTESMIRTAARISDVIKRSTHYSMLLNRRVDIYQIINTIGTEPGIYAIRIYNKRGVITFSSTHGDVGRTVDMDAEACMGCHSDGPDARPLQREVLTRIFTANEHYRVLGLITPIKNDEVCSQAACHAHPSDQTVLGVLDVMLPMKEHDELLAEEIRAQYIGAGLLVLVVTLVAGLFLWFLVYRPVRELTRGTKQIINGELGLHIPVRTGDEIGALALSFNLMTDQLRKARDEVVKWTTTLEERVDEKTGELRKAQQHLILVEKMASLGKLSATVAHELNNPLEGILTYAKLLKKRIASATFSSEQAKEIQDELSLIADESARCGNIVKNLLLFSRSRSEKPSTQDLRVIIKRTLQLIEHHLKMNNISLASNLDADPISIESVPQEIEQALFALLINAVEAMPEGGTLTVRTHIHADRETVQIVVQDTGVGIAREDLSHLFEPFFTTKKDGKGTGLGLSVVFGIIDRHGGTIDVQSEVGKGTTIIVTLPRKAGPVGTPTMPADLL